MISANIITLLGLTALTSPLPISAFVRSTPWGIFRQHAPALQVGNTAEDVETMKTLDSIAHKVKLQVFDLEEGLYGFESKDSKYGIEVQHVTIKAEPSLGIELTEMASGADGQGLVLVSGTTGNAAASPVQIGDFITGVSVPGTSFSEKTLALDYDLTVDALERARSVGNGQLTLELNRLVKRAKISVEVVGPLKEIEGGSKTIEALAGENLRHLLLRNHLRLYDSNTKRFDMPFATGDCAGEGLCGTCLVKVIHGAESLSPQDDMERLITKGRPDTWRAACRTVVGADNKEGTLKVQIHPQSDFKDELDPGVRSVRL